MRSVLLLSLSFLAAFGAAQTPQGIIRGTVTSQDSKPVSDAHVSAEVMQGSKILTVLNTNTDEFGGFTFERLDIGEYRISAEKQEAGYLSTRPDIFTRRPPLVIVLTPEAPEAATTIRFGPKAATIAGWLRDKDTGKSIAGHLSLAPISDGGWETTGTAGDYKFRLLVPADTEVRFGACAEGYKPWVYADSSDPSHPVAVKLEPGARLDVDIELERNSGDVRTPCYYGKF